MDNTPTAAMIDQAATEMDADRPHKRITVAVWLSGGCVDGARSSHPGIDFVIYDQDNMENADGVSDDDDLDSVADAEAKYDALPYGAY